eukprot:749383-Hanusia_phi.AAC.3
MAWHSRRCHDPIGPGRARSDDPSHGPPLRGYSDSAQHPGVPRPPTLMVVRRAPPSSPLNVTRMRRF